MVLSSRRAVKKSKIRTIRILFLTVWVFCQNGIGGQEWLGLSFFIDSRYLKLIEMSRLETLGRRVARCALQ